jgi:hypothetical protein
MPTKNAMELQELGQKKLCKQTRMFNEVELITTLYSTSDVK